MKDHGMPEDGRLFKGPWAIGHGSSCRWHGGRFTKAVRMIRNGRGAFVCPICDTPSPDDLAYTEAMAPSE